MSVVFTLVLSLRLLSSSVFMFRNLLILWTISAAIFHVLLGCCSPYVSCGAFPCTACIDSSLHDCQCDCCQSDRDESENPESKHESSLVPSTCENSHPSPQKPCDEVNCQFVFASRTDDTLDTISSNLLTNVQEVLPASYFLDVLLGGIRPEQPDLFLATSEPLYAIKQVWQI